jgi:putative phosphoesterase
MKIGIFQDVHANLPAFNKAIEVFRNHNCTRIYHVGDLIGIGPYPFEVMQSAINIKNLTLIMGNHDYWYAYGIPKPRPKYMNAEEYDHQLWTHKQIGKDYKSIAQKWNFVEKFKKNKICFLHYGYDAKKNWFKEYIKNPNSENLEKLFAEIEADIIFYGHNHTASDISGQSRYVNLGSAGCFNKPEVRLGILEVSEYGFTLQKRSIPYQDNGLMEAFEKRKVPAREFITSVFITRN